MIISHKEFPNFKRYEMDYCGRPFFMEVGKMAELCNASVLVGYGDTPPWPADSHTPALCAPEESDP